jgi:hypothetical protein
MWMRETLFRIGEWHFAPRVFNKQQVLSVGNCVSAQGELIDPHGMNRFFIIPSLLTTHLKLSGWNRYKVGPHCRG